MRNFLVATWKNKNEGKASYAVLTDMIEKDMISDLLVEVPVTTYLDPDLNTVPEFTWFTHRRG